jgi:hypothetical protein
VNLKSTKIGGADFTEVELTKNQVTDIQLFYLLLNGYWKE